MFVGSNAEFHRFKIAYPHVPKQENTYVFLFPIHLLSTSTHTIVVLKRHFKIHARKIFQVFFLA